MARMRRALLTTRDVKTFIEDVLYSEGLTRIQLREKLNISKFVLTGLLKKGLPWYGKPTRKRFLYSEVTKWLEDNNIILEHEGRWDI